MSQLCIRTAALGLFTWVLVLAGCGNPTPTPSPSTTDAAHDHPEVAPSDMELMKQELAKLSPEDAASAEKQHVCPVSGEMLGKMGPPKKVEVNGRQVWLCCDGCRDALLSSPEEYLAKLKKE